MRAWIDGDLLADPTQGAISVTDHGFTVGDGVFEAVKTLDGVPFALTRHLARLERSAAGLGLLVPDLDDVRRGVAAVLRESGTDVLVRGGFSLELPLRTPRAGPVTAPRRGSPRPFLTISWGKWVRTRYRVG